MIVDADYNGYLLFAFDGQYYALAPELQGVDLGAIGEEELQDLAGRGLFCVADTCDECKAEVQDAIKRRAAVGQAV